jgi:hypothetical protein
VVVPGAYATVFTLLPPEIKPPDPTGFLPSCLEGRYLDRADPEKGRFRSFLLTSLKFFVADEGDRQRAHKNGGGMVVSEAQRLKSLEDENRRLKQLVADLSLDKEALKGIVRKNGWSLPV